MDDYNTKNDDNSGNSGGEGFDLVGIECPFCASHSSTGFSEIGEQQEDGSVAYRFDDGEGQDKPPSPGDILVCQHCLGICVLSKQGKMEPAAMLDFARMSNDGEAMLTFNILDMFTHGMGTHYNVGNVHADISRVRAVENTKSIFYPIRHKIGQGWRLNMPDHSFAIRFDRGFSTYIFPVSMGRMTGMVVAAWTKEGVELAKEVEKMGYEASRGNAIWN